MNATYRLESLNGSEEVTKRTSDRGFRKGIVLITLIELFHAAVNETLSGSHSRIFRRIVPTRKLFDANTIRKVFSAGSELMMHHRASLGGEKHKDSSTWGAKH